MKKITLLKRIGIYKKEVFLLGVSSPPSALNKLQLPSQFQLGGVSLSFLPPLSSLHNSEVPAGVWVLLHLRSIGVSSWSESAQKGDSFLQGPVVPSGGTRVCSLVTQCVHLAFDQHGCLC